MGLFAAGKVGEILVGSFQLATDDPDGVGSFNSQSDPVARNPIDDDRDVSTDDETLSNFATEN